MDLKTKVTLLLAQFGIKLGLDREPNYYIGGSESLPPPLTPEEEAHWLAGYNGEEGEARQMLIEHNLRLVVYIARKFENTGVYIEDLISIGTIGLIKGVNTYRCDRNTKLATYCSRCIENEILMYLRKNSNQRSEVSLDEPLNADWDGNELLLSDVLGTEPDLILRPLEEDADRQMLVKCMKTLDDREKRILILRYGLGDREEMTQKEVADLMGISQSYISRLEKKIITRLRREMSRQM